MKKLLFFIVAIMTNHMVAQEQNACPCCTENHEQFLFWVGEWNVFDQNGKKVGENSIKKIQNGCIISENWRGEGGLNGSSHNYYDKADSTWNQLWIDNKGNILKLKGKLESPGKMVLKSKLIKGNKINWYYNKITWSKNEDGSVTQRWETYDKNNKVQSLLFLGTYKRKYY